MVDPCVEEPSSSHGRLFDGDPPSCRSCGCGPRDILGTDEAAAIHRFRRWQSKKAEPSDAYQLPTTTPVHDQFGTEIPLVGTFDDAGNPINVQYVSKAAVAAHFRQLIYSDPKRAAVELDCEPIALLANVQDLKPPTPSKPLALFVDTYLEDKTLTQISKRLERSSLDFLRVDGLFFGLTIEIDADPRFGRGKGKSVVAMTAEFNIPSVVSRVHALSIAGFSESLVQIDEDIEKSIHIATKKYPDCKEVESVESCREAPQEA